MKKRILEFIFIMIGFIFFSWIFDNSDSGIMFAIGWLLARIQGLDNRL